MRGLRIGLFLISVSPWYLLPLAWFIASFFLMSAIAHASAGWFLRGRYEAWLARGMNPLRWVEYAFSSTVMILAIAYNQMLAAMTGFTRSGRNVACVVSACANTRCTVV